MDDIISGHGGDVYEASRRTGIPVLRLIDFSASINPLGVPKSAAAAIKRHVAGLAHYPEPFSGRLAGYIEKRSGLKPGSVVCGNGSTELIYLIPRALGPHAALVTAPAFSEYERACAATGVKEIRRLALKAADGFRIGADDFIKAMRGCDMAFLCNPNNPTGGLLKKDGVLKVADAARDFKCTLVVDEAFVDFCPGESVIKEVASNPYLIVLRSLTKFYALPGLRVGYGVFPDKAYEAVMRQKEPWTVNSLAEAAAVSVLGDAEYEKMSLKTMKKEKAHLEKGLKKAGIEYVPSEANFYLLKVEDACEARRALMEKCMLVRDCSNFIGLDGGYVRVAVRTREENSALVSELKGLAGVSHKGTVKAELERIASERFKEPLDIERRSFDIISSEADFTGIPKDRLPVIKRVIHATADFEFARTLTFHKDAVKTGIEMIRAGHDILTDVEMVRTGINAKGLSRWGGKVLCNIRMEGGAKKPAEGMTRSEMGIESALAENGNIGIVAVGNAPTALLKVIELLNGGMDLRTPPLVVGVPVGFVKAAESKALLGLQRYPFITNNGRKGGTPVAVAIINALIKMAAEGDE